MNAAPQRRFVPRPRPGAGPGRRVAVLLGTQVTGVGQAVVACLAGRRGAFGFGATGRERAVPAHRPDTEGRHQDQGDGDGEPGADPALHGAVRRARQVPEQAVADTPDQSAEDVVDEERPVRHADGAGGGGHHRTHERDEPAEHDRQAAAVTEGLPGPMRPAGQPAHGARGEQAVTHPPADLVADDRAGHRGDHDHGRQRGQRQVAPAGQHAAQDHRRLTGQHEPEEHRRLAEDERRDHCVGDPPGQVGQPADDRAHRQPLPAARRRAAAASGS